MTYSFMTSGACKVMDMSKYCFPFELVSVENTRSWSIATSLLSQTPLAGSTIKLHGPSSKLLTTAKALTRRFLSNFPYLTLLHARLVPSSTKSTSESEPTTNVKSRMATASIRTPSGSRSKLTAHGDVSTTVMRLGNLSKTLSAPTTSSSER